MTEKISPKTVYRLLAVLTAISTVLLFILFTAFFDPESGYFDTTANATAVKVLFSISSVLCFAISLIPIAFHKSRLEKKATVRPCATVRATAAIAVILGALQITLTFLGVIQSVPRAYPFCGLGCAALGAYFLLKEKLSGTPLYSLLLLFLSCALPIGAAIGNNSTYTRHINSVENTLTVVFSIFFMLYTLYEENILRGKSSRFRITSALLVSSSGITYSLAYITAYLFGAVCESARFVQTLLVFAVCMLIALETFAASSAITEEEVNSDNPTDDFTEETGSDNFPDN